MQGSLPAVDGVNGKLSGFGGSRAGQAIYGADGAITVPLGTRFGLQLDGLAAGFNSQSQTSLAVVGTGAHLFWRDPAVGLFGAYGNYVHSNAFGSSNYGSGAGEGALYLNRIRLDALVGVQGATGNPAWFFDVAQLSYYPIDNLRGWSARVMCSAALRCRSARSTVSLPGAAPCRPCLRRALGWRMVPQTSSSACGCILASATSR